MRVSPKVELRNALNGVEQHWPRESLGRPDQSSIAVLADENMSGDPEQGYFSDGIIADVITALSRSPWLFIIARNTRSDGKVRVTAPFSNHSRLGDGELLTVSRFQEGSRRGFFSGLPNSRHTSGSNASDMFW